VDTDKIVKALRQLDTALGVLWLIAIEQEDITSMEYIRNMNVETLANFMGVSVKELEAR
jgi:hypothetical protein